jgi:hypothetical protein
MNKLTISSRITKPGKSPLLGFYHPWINVLEHDYELELERKEGHHDSIRNGESNQNSELRRIPEAREPVEGSKLSGTIESDDCNLHGGEQGLWN